MTRRRYKKLPPHTWEAHPHTDRGEVNKPFVIGIIVVVALIALALLLFFTDSFSSVGKAFDTGGLEIDEAGVSGFRTYAPSEQAHIPIVVNIGNKESLALGFELQYDPEVLTYVAINFEPLQDLYLGEENGETYPLNVQDSLQSKIITPGTVQANFSWLYDSSGGDNYLTGERVVAYAIFNAKNEGETSVGFTNFDVIDFATQEPIALSLSSGTVTVEVEGEVLDTDGDGIPDAVDNCPEVVGSQSDLDGDGIGNPCDPDIDGDGFDNDVDNCPDSAIGVEVDEFGCGDLGLLDSDDDGLPDSLDKCPNDPDNDADFDGYCVGDGPNPGVNDNDNCPLIPNAGQTDTDGDGVGDACDEDADADADGIPEEGFGHSCYGAPFNIDGATECNDNCPLVANADQLDADGDGVGDACDNCPGTISNDVTDSDGDGFGDVCQDDFDGDGVANTVDNCLMVANNNQADTDGDGIGDACDDVDDTVGEPEIDETPEGVSVQMFDLAGNEVTTTQVTPGVTYVIQITVNPTANLENHLVLGKVSYGGVVETQFSESKDPADAGVATLNSFSHAVPLDATGEMKVEAFVWNSWLSSEVSWSSLEDPVEVLYNVE